MTTRDELYRRFGPLELEAIVRALIDQINVLIVNAGLPEITLQQAMDAIETELDALPFYDWM